MRIPNFEKLKESRFKVSLCTPGMHPKPRFYKYYWHVFWEGSLCDGDEFFKKENRMTTKKAFDFIEELKKMDKPCWVYNHCYPRLDPSNPFDVNSARWQGISWAVSWDDDTDEEYKGHK